MVRERRGSVSLLQRALGIGYGRGARLIDFMAEDGIVGEYNGSQAREVLISLEEWETMSRNGEAAAANAPADAASSGATVAPRYVTVGGAGTSAAAASGPSNAMTVASTSTVKPPRRNRIVPEPVEPSDLEDEGENDKDESISFDPDAADDYWEEVDEVADDEWEEDEDADSHNLDASATSDDDVDEAADEEEIEDSDADESEAGESDAADADEWEESDEEWEENQELSQK